MKAPHIKFRFDELSIVKGVRAEGPELTAAATMREKFAKEAGVKVPIVSENENRRFNKKTIILGTPTCCDLFRKMKKPKHDGWIINVDDEYITLLSGIPRGVLYATDQFLNSLKIEKDGFTLKKGSVLEEPSFPTRVIMHHWDPEFTTTEPEIMSRYRFNGCVMTGIESDSAVLLKDSFPEIYRLLENKARAQRLKRREGVRAKKLETIHNNFGINYYIYLAMGIPNELREAVYKNYPEIKGTDHPDSYEKAHICPSNPTSWKIWRAIVQEVIEMYPCATGVYMDIMHNGYGIYCQCERCRSMGLNAFPAEIKKALSETYKVLKKQGKKLLYHTWTTGSKPRKGRSQGSDSGRPWHLPGDRPEWVFRPVIEWTPPEIELVKMDTWGDVLPTAPLDPLIGKTGKHPQIVQFQIAGEYRGFNKVPCSMVQYLKDRVSTCYEKGVSGILSVVGGWVDPYYIFWKDIINSVNFEANARLAWNVDEDADEIWRSWADKIYGMSAAPMVIAALKLSQSVIEKSLAIKGMNFNDHSGYPDSLARTWEVTWDWSNYWYPDSHERFAISLENIEEIIEEKEEALTMARKMLTLIDKAKSQLKKTHYRELRERTEWLYYYATIQRYLAEIYFRMLYIEEHTKEVKTNARQLVRIDKAVIGIKGALAKLPKSVKKQSYYEKLPQKDIPVYPIFPWLPSHAVGHPVIFANMMRAHAANIVQRIRAMGKTN